MNKLKQEGIGGIQMVRWKAELLGAHVVVGDAGRGHAPDLCGCTRKKSAGKDRKALADALDAWVTLGIVTHLAGP